MTKATIDSNDPRRHPEVVLMLNRAYFDVSPAEHFRAQAAVLARLGDELDKEYLPAAGEFSVKVQDRLRSREALTFATDREQRKHLLITESFILAHHAGESLLRRYLAHLAASKSGDSPWVILTDMTDAREFRDELRQIQQSSNDDLSNGVEACFLGDRSAVLAQVEDAEGLATAESCLSSWLRHFARFYLDSAPAYNATKHGLSSRPGHQLVTLDFQDDDGVPHTFELLRGAVLDTLESEQVSGKKRGTRRWFRMTRQVDPEGLISSVLVAANLLETMRSIGRSRHLGEEQQVRLFDAPTPADVFAEGGGYGSAYKIDIGVFPDAT